MKHKYFTNLRKYATNLGDRTKAKPEGTVIEFDSQGRFATDDDEEAKKLENSLINGFNVHFFRLSNQTVMSDKEKAETDNLIKEQSDKIAKLEAQIKDQGDNPDENNAERVRRLISEWYPDQSDEAKSQLVEAFKDKTGNYRGVKEMNDDQISDIIIQIQDDVTKTNTDGAG